MEFLINIFFVHSFDRPTVVRSIHSWTLLLFFGCPSYALFRFVCHHRKSINHFFSVSRCSYIHFIFRSCPRPSMCVCACAACVFISMIFFSSYSILIHIFHVILFKRIQCIYYSRATRIHKAHKRSQILDAREVYHTAQHTASTCVRMFFFSYGFLMNSPLIWSPIRLITCEPQTAFSLTLSFSLILFFSPSLSRSFLFMIIIIFEIKSYYV